MKELSFRNAGLDTLPREVFAHADTLEHLDLSGNHFTSLPDEFTRLHSLRRLFLSNNPCEELPRVIGQMPQLEMVVLKSCHLNRVAEDALPVRLRWLTLTDNQLEFLPESLGHRPRLQKLALAGNRLRALPGSISNATALELIRVSANALEQFPRALLALPRLAWFAWAGNPFCTRPDVAAQPIAWDALQLHEVLGSGASGVISRATRRDTGAQVAVKVFKGAVTSDGWPEDEVRACLLAGQHEHLVALEGRVVGHPEGAEALVLALIPPSYRALGGPPDFESCTRDVMPPDLHLSSAQALHIARGVVSLVGGISMPVASATGTFTRTTPGSTTRATRWSATSERRTCSRGLMPTSVPAWSGPKCVPSERCSMISSAAEPHPRSPRCGTRAGHRTLRRSHRWRVDHDLLLSVPPADRPCRGGPQFLQACARGPRAAMAKAKLFNVADSIHNVLRSEEKNLPSS